MNRRDPLARYREMRRFGDTPEPSGRRSKRDRPPVFVIQMHAARSLHYDFRLEVAGVLASWAVPKGPSTDPRAKRLAVQVEDHPVDYGDFEGAIPTGNYGAGAVIVWDAGPYRNLRDEPVEQGIEDGHLSIWLEGQKIRGGYSLTRTGERRGKAQWILVKRRDEHADARRKPTSTQRESVLSGRTVEDVAAGR
jgi:DNA ligase D-like protein (predicted 3'-phosphoesterase)